jgi:hypothetical protein
MRCVACRQITTYVPTYGEECRECYEKRIYHETRRMCRDHRSLGTPEKMPMNTKKAEASRRARIKAKKK